MNRLLIGLMLLVLCAPSWADEGARVVEPAYESPKAVFEFYFEEPGMIGTALYWVRSLINPLMDSPYDMAPEFMDIKVVIHGTEIATVVKKNNEKYAEAVERMRYYAALGVEFKVCGMAAHDYGYETDDFYEFIEVVPSAITELVHWQQQGYGLIMPRVYLRTRSIEETR